MKKLAFISLIFTIVIASSLVLVNTNLTPVFAILLDLSHATADPHAALEVNAVGIPAANTDVIGVSTENRTLTNLPDEIPVQKEPLYPFGNPAGCTTAGPSSSAEMLANVQFSLGDEIDLAGLRQTYIWNGPGGTMLDVTEDPFVMEFEFNTFAPPLTYLGDRLATIFLVNGFTVWFRQNSGSFRLLAVPMLPGVFESPWRDYVSSYWQKDGLPQDATIYPVAKKLPCHWMIDNSYVSNEQVEAMFDLDWSLPDFRNAGTSYLASGCQAANQIALEKMDTWSSSVMCGPLTWTILRDSNNFPYRMGSWSGSSTAFVGANPRWSGQPWSSFDPETFDLIHVQTSMPGYDFQEKGNLFPGDIVYSFATLYVTPGYFDHIFMVTGIDQDGSRLSTTNMIHASPGYDCQIQEVILYTPGDQQLGVINYEWNGYGFGRTGTTGFDIFRWKWISYHTNGQPIQYTVRWGDTIDTIAFDWKVSPDGILQANSLTPEMELTPGQLINLPVPQPFEPGNTLPAGNADIAGL